MLVNPSPPRTHFPQAAKPLPALHCNVLAASESSTQLQWPESPKSAYRSPLQRHFRDVLQSSPSQLSISPQHKTASPAVGSGGGGVQARDPSPGRKSHGSNGGKNDNDSSGGGYLGLGHGIDLIGSHADLFSQSRNANARTRGAFKPQRAQKGTNSWQLKQFAEATLGSGSLRKVVKLPEGEDKDEWLAVNGMLCCCCPLLYPFHFGRSNLANHIRLPVVDFYNQVNLIYGAITEFCSPQSCPEMKATDEFEYLWHNPPDFSKPTRLPAPSYISHLLTWTSNHLSNPDIFPTHPGVPFPPSFQSTIKQIFKRLYRIYAHIYCHHYGVIRGLGLEAHLNTGFKHYVLFVEEFGLADEGGRREAKAEWYGPLGELVESMLRSD